MIAVHDEFVEFIASGTTPQSILDFRPSDETKSRVAELIRLQKADTLSPDETADLSHYFHIEQVMRLAKARTDRITRYQISAGILS